MYVFRLNGGEDILKEIFKSLALLTEVGLVLVICIGGGLLLGIYLDRKLETKALFTIALLFIGIGSGFWTVYRMVFPRGGD